MLKVSPKVMTFYEYLLNELKKAVSAGDLTQAQADKINQQLQNNPQMLEKLLNGSLRKGQK